MRAGLALGQPVHDPHRDLVEGRDTLPGAGVGFEAFDELRHSRLTVVRCGGPRGRQRLALVRVAERRADPGKNLFATHFHPAWP